MAQQTTMLDSNFKATRMKNNQVKSTGDDPGF